MDDNVYWLKLWSMVGFCACIFVVLGVVSGALADHQITNLVKAGANPIAARCAIKGMDSSVHLICDHSLVAPR